MFKLMVLLILVLVSSAIADPGDLLGVVHDFGQDRFDGLTINFEDSLAYLCNRSYGEIWIYDCYTWNFQGSWSAPDSKPRSLSYYKRGPEDDIALSGLDSQSIYILSAKQGAILKMFSAALAPACLDYVREVGCDTTYLRITEYRGKYIMRYSVPDYAFIDTTRSDVVMDYDQSSFCGLCYDGGNNFLVAVVYQYDGSTVHGLDMYGLNPATCKKIEHVNLSWANGIIYDLVYARDYPGYGRCYLANYYNLSICRSTIIAIAPFEKTGFSSKQRAKKIPNKRNLRAYPCPFSDRLTITAPSSGAIYDLTGNVVTKLSKGKHSLSTTDWQPGVYLVRSGSETRQIVKLR